MNIPQFIHSPTEGHLSGLEVLAIMNKAAAVNTVCRFCVGIKCLIHLGKYLGAQLLDLMITL